VDGQQWCLWIRSWVLCLQAGKLARSIWAETCATEEKDAILGVQQARNAMTACTYLATISVAMATAGEYMQHPWRCLDTRGKEGWMVQAPFLLASVAACDSVYIPCW
jgi:hypothetical protein